jgi:Predicted membrane protein (DUF2207)
VILGQVLAGSSTSESASFSIPLLVVAGAAGVAWLLVLGVLISWRQPGHIEAGPASQELPPVTPAVAGFLCDDFELSAELPPATLLDLAARRVVRLEEVAPGKTICRLRQREPDQPLAAYEKRVLGEVTHKATDGVVPTDALTTGTEDVSSRWHRAYSKEVIADAHRRGLSKDRWPRTLVMLVGVGPFAIGALLYAASAVGGDTSGGSAVPAVVAGGVAGAAILVLIGAAAALSRSLAQLPTPAGKDMAAHCLGLQSHLRQNEQLAELPPAAVQLWGRHFAYAGAMGVARTAIELLPFGAEDDNHAWSRFGGRWRRVYVRYPRGWPPGWGKHPAFALLLAVLWGAVSIAAIYGLVQLAQAAADPITSTDPTFTREQLDWIGRGALLLTIPFAVVLLWALYLIVRAVPDLWMRRTASGDLVRARARRQIFQSSNENPNYWYYLALDDGTRPRIRSWRVRRDLYRARTQGETVEIVFTPNLGYVREIRPTPATATAT